MMVQNKVNFYPDGYAVANGGSCIDLPIAIAAGSMFEESYYQYLFSRSYDVNWSLKNLNSLENQCEILSKMNYKLSVFDSMSWQDVLDKIFEIIEQKGFALMPVTYNALFYYLGLKSTAGHMILISGYDRDEEILIVNDCNFINHGLPLINKDYTIYQAAMRFESVRHIWEVSIKTMDLGNEEGHLYALQESDSKHSPASEYIKDYLSQELTSDDGLCKKDRFRNVIFSACNMSKAEAGDYMYNVRRQYLGWLHPFFDYFRFLEDKVIAEKVQLFANRLYKIRDSQITKVHFRLLRESRITPDYINALLIESDEIEKEIGSIIRENWR